MEYNGLRVCAPDKACMHLWVMCARALSFIYLEIMEFARLFSFFMVLSFIMELCNEYSSIAWECWWRIVNWPWPWPCSTYHARARAHTHTMSPLKKSTLISVKVLSFTYCPFHERVWVFRAVFASFGRRLSCVANSPAHCSLVACKQFYLEKKTDKSAPFLP